MEEAFIETPLGMARIRGNSAGIASIDVLDQPVPKSAEIPALLADAATQLEEYFEGDRKSFQLKLNPGGTAFQKKVWKALMDIPHGKTLTYLQLSKVLGDPLAIRAVAAANARNPIWIIIPCHRVIGSDGSLTGYAGGLHRKKWLLNHEAVNKQISLF